MEKWMSSVVERNKTDEEEQHTLDGASNVLGKAQPYKSKIQPPRCTIVILIVVEYPWSRVTTIRMLVNQWTNKSVVRSV